MPDDVAITFEEAGQMDLSDAAATPLSQAQGSTLVTSNGFSNTRAQEVDKSSWNVSWIDISRS